MKEKRKKAILLKRKCEKGDALKRLRMSIVFIYFIFYMVFILFCFYDNTIVKKGGTSHRMRRCDGRCGEGMPADKKSMKGQGKRKGRREEVKMEQGKEEGECRGTSLYKPMPVVLFALILIVVMIPLSQAEQQQQIVEIWNKTWGTYLYDAGYGIAVDSYGYIYVTGYGFYRDGYLSDVFLLKYAPDGNLIWKDMGWNGL